MKLSFPALALLLFLVFGGSGAAAQADSLRIITYNIHHAGPPARPGTVDIAGVVRALSVFPADVIALQEVDVHTRRSGHVDQAKAIGEALGMHVFFARAIRYDSGDYGVAILSRFPLEAAQAIPLPFDTLNPGEARVLATAKIRLPSGRVVRIASTHFDHRKDPKSRALQVEAVRQFAAGEETPFVLAGDLNALPESENIAALDRHFERSCNPCPLTFPAVVPDRTIDYIYFSRGQGIRVLSSFVVPEPEASDHLPLRAVILLGGGKKGKK